MQSRRRHHVPTASFFVRLWLERGEKSQWRGQVRHVQSGETAYFVDVQNLLAFVANHGGQAFIESTQERKEVKSDAVSHHTNASSGELPD